MHTSLFQAPFNQVSVRIVGDETAPSLFRLDSQNVVRVISGADLQRDPTRVYKVSILYLCAVWSLTPDQLSSCRAGIVSMPILRSSCSGMLCCLKEDIVFFFCKTLHLCQFWFITSFFEDPSIGIWCWSAIIDSRYCGNGHCLTELKCTRIQSWWCQLEDPKESGAICDTCQGECHRSWPVCKWR